MLAECGAPPNIEPLLAAAIDSDQPAAVQLLIGRCGLPSEPRRSLMAAIRKGQPAVVQQLLAGSSLVPGTEELVAAIGLPSSPVVRALLAAGCGPAAVPPLAGAVELFGPTDNAMRYSCPVLAAMQERARTVRLQCCRALTAACMHTWPAISWAGFCGCAAAGVGCMQCFCTRF